MKKLSLRQQIIMGLIMGGVAFVTSASLAFFQAAAGVPADKTTNTWFIGLSFGVVVSVIYMALAGNRRVPIADAATREAALRPLSDGTGRLIVYRHGFIGKAAGVDVSVDGAVRTQLKSPRFAALSLTPGRHVIETEVQNRRSDPMEIAIGANETVVVQVIVTFGKTKLVQQQDFDGMRASLSKTPMVQA
ncbi:hypothetical protein [Sphingomonas xinjiangensis]|uniref:DUF2846 domain-containing protein n=1 Tax=Sphingomonas xinjiangensis TaxID=643568 RepID=A0A840YIL3_9SPHN|nr:hypothetical protein [Sphingomonas xinjiangensis]MBB5712285.1 hypothetical protein [Sphingomonas xinjiangensis]